ncbi:MAG: ABC transporter substrate-binding protein, partial [Vicinamibacteria bacterium]|nr:ABC transporter substrate-binding protein [Vicinamibacteria bacterium]
MDSSNYWTRTIRRRRLLAATAGTALVAAVGAACGDDDDDGGGSAFPGGGTSPAAGSPIAQQPRRGGAIRISMYLNPPHLDALQGTSSQAIPLAAVQDGLLGYEAGPGVGVHEQKLRPALAAALPEQQSATSMTFKLNPAAKWSDGTAVTASDVKFTLEKIKGGAGSYSAKAPFQVLESVDAIDPQTVTIKTSRPSAALMRYLSEPTAFIVPAAAYQRLVDFKKEVVGSGPYKLDRFEPNVSIRLVRNPEHWNSGAEGWADTIDWSIIQEDSTRLAAYHAGKHDIEGLYPFLSQEMRKQIESSDTEFTEALTNYGTYLIPNNTKAPFNDERVRKAFHLAINRQQMIATWGNGKGQVNGPIPAVYTEFALTQDELLKRPGLRAQKDQDLKDARALLDQAGIKSLDVDAIGGQDYQTAGPMLQVARNNLAAIGVNLNIQLIDNQTVRARHQSGDFTFSSTPHTTVADIDGLLISDYRSDSALAFARPKDSALDSMIDKQSQAM